MRRTHALILRRPARGVLRCVSRFPRASFAQGASRASKPRRPERQRQLEVLRGELTAPTMPKPGSRPKSTRSRTIARSWRKRCSMRPPASARSKPGSRRPRSACPSSTSARQKSNPRWNPRRAVLAEVLAALQKIGRRPPPALILRPEDALDWVRSAILLGAIIPELKTEADALAADLAELARFRREIAAERDALAQNRVALEDERRRTAAFGEERRRQQSENEKALEAERTKTQALARQVETVRELIARMEKEIASAANAAEIARRRLRRRPPPPRWPIPPELRPLWRSRRPAAACRCRFQGHECVNLVHPMASEARNGAF